MLFIWGFGSYCLSGNGVGPMAYMMRNNPGYQLAFVAPI